MRPSLVASALVLSTLPAVLAAGAPAGAQTTPPVLRIGGSSTGFPIMQLAKAAYQQGGRSRDVLAIAYGRSRLNPQLWSAENRQNSPYEAVLEVNYSWQVNQRLSLQPVLQLILHPDGRNTEPILATGLGLNLSF